MGGITFICLWKASEKEIKKWSECLYLLKTLEVFSYFRGPFNLDPYWRLAPDLDSWGKKKNQTACLLYLNVALHAPSLCIYTAEPWSSLGRLVWRGGLPSLTGWPAVMSGHPSQCKTGHLCIGEDRPNISTFDCFQLDLFEVSIQQTSPLQEKAPLGLSLSCAAQNIFVSGNLA